MASLVLNPSLDGYAGRHATAPFEAWATIHDSAGNNHADAASPLDVIQLSTDTVSLRWKDLVRAGFDWDLSNPALTGVTITAITFEIFITAHLNNYATDFPVVMTAFTPGSHINLADSDYGNFGTTSYSNTAAFSTFTNSAYNLWTLNATAITAAQAAIGSKWATGLRFDADRSNTEPTQELSKDAIITIQTRSAANPPKLTITYTSAASAFTPQLLTLGVG